MSLGTDSDGEKSHVVECFSGYYLALDVFGDGCPSPCVLLSDHLVALSVKLDDVGANGSYSHSAHLGNLSVGQNFSVEAIKSSVPVLHESQYLVRSQMASNNSR